MLNSQRLRNLRKDRGLKQEDVANALNIQRTTYVKYEKNGIQPPNDMVVKLAEFYGVTTDYLFGLTNIAKPINNPISYEQTIEEAIKNSSDLSEESQKDLLKQLELLKLRDKMKEMNEEVSEELRPRLT